MSKLIRLDHLLPGTVVKVRKPGGLWHIGMLSDRWFDGMPMVFASSPDTSGVAEIPWQRFSRRQQVWVIGYPGDLPWWEVIERANELVGLGYHPALANCEHFVSHCHGFEPNSPTLKAIVAVAALAAATIVLSKATA